MRRKSSLFILLIFLTFVSGANGQEPDTLVLIPAPRIIEKEQGVFRFSEKTGFRYNKKDENLSFIVSQIIDEVRQAAKITLKPKKGTRKSRIELSFFRTKNNVPDSILQKIKDQGYVLRITPRRIFIRAFTSRGLFYGAQTLRQLIRIYGREAAIPCLKITDWPLLKYRGWQDDISRGPIPTMDFLKREIRELSFYKLNLFTLYTEHVFKLKKHPDIAPPDGITKEQVEQLVSYAKKYHVEIAGNFQSFGHAKHILKLPEYKAMAETPYVFSPAKEDTYAFLKDAYSETAPAYESPLFNINCDETYGLGRGPAKTMVDTMGLGGVYAYHINRIHRLLFPYKKRIMMWGDILVQHPEVIGRLPSDIIFLTWAYHTPETFMPIIKPFSKRGLNFMVCPGISCWNRIWPDLQTALKNISLFVKEGAENGAMGMLNTTWDDDGENLFNFNWYPLIWGAQCSWSPQASKFLSKEKAERDRELRYFNRAFDLLFFGTNGRGISDLMLSLSSLRKFKSAGSLSDSRFWREIFTNKAQDKKGSADYDLFASAADNIGSLFYKVAADSIKNRDAFDAAFFALKRVKFLSVKEKTESLLETPIAQADNSGKTNLYLNNLRKLESDLDNLKKEYIRLWNLENREWWLDRNLRKYDSLLSGLNKAENPVMIMPDSTVFSGSRRIYLKTPLPADKIRYFVKELKTGKINGPFDYTSPFLITKTSEISAESVKRGKVFGPFKRNVYVYNGRVKNIVLKNMYSSKYPALGLFTLVDGKRGSRNFRDGKWLGFFGEDFEAVIDLGKSTRIKNVSIGFLQQTGPWIMLPLWVEFSFSDDSVSFSSPIRVYPKTDAKAESAIEDFTADPGEIKARYLKIYAKNRGVLPKWHPSAGSRVWIFTDEIFVGIQDQKL